MALTAKRPPEYAADSVVGGRLAWLQGKRILVILAGSGDVAEAFEAVYFDTLPMGREYFFVFVVEDGKKRLVKTPGVIEIREL